MNEKTPLTMLLNESHSSNNSQQTTQFKPSLLIITFGFLLVVSGFMAGYFTGLTQALREKTDENNLDLQTSELQDEVNVENKKPQVSFWYPEDAYLTHLYAFDEYVTYGVFFQQENLQLCAEHIEVEQTSYMNSQSLELYPPCVENAYTVLTYPTSYDDFVGTLIPQTQETYIDSQQREWTYETMESSAGYYRVTAAMSTSDNMTHAVTIDALVSATNPDIDELIAIAKKTFDSFEVHQE